MCFYFLRVNGRQQPRTLQIDSRFKVILEVLQEFLTLALHVTASPHQPCRVLMRLCNLLHRKCSGREAWQMPLFLGALGALGDSDHPWLAWLSTQCRTRLGDEAAQVPQEAVGFGCVEGFGQGATRKEPAVAFLMATAMGPWACLQSVETQHLEHQPLVALIALAPVLTRLWSSGPKNAACRCHRILKALVYAYMNSLLDTYCQNHISTLPESTVRYPICKSSSNMANVSMPSFSIRLDAWDPLLVEPQELDITKDLVWCF